MFGLAKLGVLPSVSLDWKDDVPLCTSCMFGTTIVKAMDKNGKKSGSISKETDNKSGAGVSVD